MRQKWTIVTGHICCKSLLICLFLAVVFLFILILLVTSEQASAGIPIGFAQDTAPPVINASSEPTEIFNITIWDSDGPTLLYINVTIQNLSSFQPDTDLEPLEMDETSGVMIYKETNGQTGFQPDDTPIGITPTAWIVGGPGMWITSFDSINMVLAPNFNFFYVVVRTSTFISNNETFMIGIMQGDIKTDHGNIPTAGDNWTSPIRVDTKNPDPNVVIRSPGSILRIGDWVNITAIVDDNITKVTVDLSDFNGLSPNEPMIYDNVTGAWFYNLTTILKGNVDTGLSGYPFTVTAIDHANNMGMGTNDSISVDTISPSCAVIVNQRNSPAGIGNWINITVFTDSDVVSVEGDLSAFTGLNTSETFRGSGSFWWLNFTVAPGTLDGVAPIKVTVMDDSGYIEVNDTEYALVDEISPSMEISVYQSKSPAGVGDWINITVVTDSDVVIVEGDYASSGITGQSDNTPFLRFNGTSWYFNFTIAAGITDVATPLSVTLRAQDDAENLNLSTADVALDEVYPQPLGVHLILQSGGSGQAKIGDWINITIDMGVHNDIISMIVDTSGIFASEPVTNRAGSVWFLNTTLAEGSIDGEVTFLITVIDDAGNLATASNSTHIDINPPATAFIESVSDGTSATPDTIFKGLVTINAKTDSADIQKVSFYDGEPWGLGIWLGDDFSFPYALVWSTTGDDDGNHTLYVRVYDDAGNFLDSQAFFITVDNVDDQPESVIKWYNRASSINLTLSITGDGQNSVKWDLYQDSLPYLSGTVTKTEDKIDSEHYEISMDLDSEYEMTLIYSGQVGTNSMALTFEFSDVVYTLFYTFDSQDVNSHEVTLKIADILHAMGVVTLDGSSSFDPDGIITDYRWFLDGESVGTARQFTTIFSDKRNYEVSLQVTSDDVQTNQTITAINLPYYKTGSERSDIISNSTFANYLRYADVKALIFESQTAGFLVRDTQGHAMGVLGGNFVNQIPGSQLMIMLGGTTLYTVPLQLDLRCEISGLENGIYHLEMLKSLEGYSQHLFFVSPLNQSGKDFFQFSGDMDKFGAYTQSQEMTYSLTLVNKTSGTEKTFNLTDIRLALGENHSYEVADWGALDKAKGAVRLNIDDNGDGATDYSLEPENGWTGLDVQNAISIKPGKTPAGFPLTFVLILGFSVALGAGSLIFLLTEIGKVSFFYFFYVTYTRIKREYVLDNFTRGEIFGYIKANPGVHFSEIKRALELKNGSLAYHIRTLEKQELVISRHDRGYKRFYPKAMKLPERNIRELIPVQRSIMQIVKEHPGISQTNIAERLDISFQLVHYHVKILREADYLVLEKDGKQTYWYDKETYEKENT